MTSRLRIAAALALAASGAIASTASPQNAPTPEPTPRPGGNNPADAETPALRNRLFSSDTSSYDVKSPLGRFAIVDRKKSVVTEYLEKGRFACDPEKALETAVSPPLKPSLATSTIAERGYSGSLSVFIGGAEISDQQRQELTVTDIAQADVTNECQLSRRKIFDIANSLVGAEGLSVIWVSGATLSNLNKRMYDRAEGGIKGGGSWLSIGADGYKGSEKTDSVPIIALRGYVVNVPGERPPGVFAKIVPDVRPFRTIADLGLAPGYRVRRAVRPLVPR